ncbi:serine/arginine repetitive matrix protein 3-like [Vulpes lagopus]|uniref:serine/arginine repetitive matrix protein 3-like n=1 Tax=Vulpes lagopus TaxID=494514 RepID=UPI001BC93D82|nr:serine/arginine repetitive matrix protein 3-like [Vulpes lagopus]
MVSPAGLSGWEEGNQRRSISQLLGRGEEEEEEAAGRRSQRRAAQRKGSSRLPPGESQAGWSLSSYSGGCAKLPTPPPALLRRRRQRRRWRPHNPTWLRGRTRPQDAGRGGARRKRAAAGRAREKRPPLPPRPAYRAGPGPARFRPGRGLRGAGGGGDRACGSPLLCSFPRVWAGRPPSARNRSGPREFCGRTPLRSVCAAPGPPSPGMALMWGAQEPDVLTAGPKDLGTEDGEAVTRSPVLLGRSCRILFICS